MVITPQRPDLPSEVDEYLGTFAKCVEGVLGQELMGSYLHGSGVLDGFNPARSDIDILVVSFRPLRQNQRTRMRQELGTASLRVPAATLEMSVVTSDTCKSPVASLRLRYANYISTLVIIDASMVLAGPSTRVWYVTYARVCAYPIIPRTTPLRTSYARHFSGSV